jgi:hypothetical protein
LFFRGLGRRMWKRFAPDALLSQKLGVSAIYLVSHRSSFG